ncbi:MAG: hypothetical protein AAF631_05105 [Pseudomonadota bacterium]
MKPLLLLLAGLVFGVGIGFVTAAGLGMTLRPGPGAHDHADPAQHPGMDASAHAAHMAASGGDHGAHDHTPLDLPAGPGAPRLDAHLMKDANAGFNLHVLTHNFAFAPTAVNGANVPGQGHAHVYVNGKKVSRLYSPWLHIEALPPGATVTVELNANDHSPISVGGTPLRVELRAPE